MAYTRTLFIFYQLQMYTPFYFAVDLQTYFNISSQCQGRAHGVLHPSRQKFKWQIGKIFNFCWKICATLSSHSVKTLCREIKPLVSEFYGTVGRIVTSMYRGVAREFRQGGARPNFPTKGCGRGEIFPDKGVAHVTLDDAE